LEDTAIPRVDQKHLEARREQILEAAIECFAHNGFHRTTMQDIMREAGLSVGAPYRYFKSKEQMIEAIAAERRARDREIILEAGAKEDIPKVLRTLIDRFEQALLDPRDRKGRRMAMQLWTEALRNPRILKTVRKGVDEPRRMLAAIVTRARDNDEMPKDIDPDAMARVLIALFQGFALQLAWDPRIDPKPFAKAIERMFAAMLSRA
jgi:TetR/AcrR family transcriptional regulator, transcriptional repressor of aconitase